MSVMKIPLIRPNPAKLSGLGAELAGLEASGIFSNYGPLNTRFEQEVQKTIFGGVGACVTVCNATIGLMLALKHAAGTQPGTRRFALMPSFTFAAAAHAALWAGLTPLLCDIDEATWTPSAAAEQELLERFGAEIAVVFPYATFGNDLDLDRYDALSRRSGIPVVIDAAASLGTVARDGTGFGTGCPHPLVYSLHVTKAFATLEGGLIYSADPATVEALRAMGNFGFAEPRVASMPGLNSKLSEVVALMGLEKLKEFEQVIAHRIEIAEAYYAELAGWTFQRLTGRRHAFTFMPVLLPESCADRRRQILKSLADEGIGASSYFSPHVAEHPYFRQTCVTGDLAVTERIGRRIITLPMSDTMTADEVAYIARVLRNACGNAATESSPRPTTPH
jgi:dTDP-4-amino-4,6-dideoxygalactose transaminase